MRRCVSTLCHPDGLTGRGAVMSTQQRRTSSRLEVAVMFEPSRLAADHLADAYARVVPAVSRRSRPAAQPMPVVLLRRRQP